MEIQMSSRPTTPSSSRRKLHRSSGIFALIPQSPKIHYPVDANNLPLDSAINTDNFALLSDAMEELEDNMSSLQQIHHSISNGFNESFAGFLYGILMTMWCVDFPGLPSKSEFDKITYSTQLDEEIAHLNHEIQALQQDNESLKQTALNKSKIHNSHVLKPKSIINRPTPLTKQMSKGTNSKIPAPKRPLSAQKVVDTPSRSSGGPNLNQPPRYLQGLFNDPKTPTSSRRIQKPTSIHNRPPFR